MTRRAPPNDPGGVALNIETRGGAMAVTYSADYCVSSEMKDQFDRDGYIVIKSLLSPEELSRLRSSLEQDSGILKHSYGVNDGHGRNSRMCLWNHPGNDITGMVARCEKVAGTMEQLLGGEVYHYHTKLMMKEAHTGGSFVWHQDYGYWYLNGCLFPDMGTAFIAIDKCDQENGCLKVLKGSHCLGRIDHVRVGSQTGADVERVKMVEKVLPTLRVELDHHHPMYTPLVKVPDSAILECKSLTDLSGKDFMNPSDDRTIGSTST